MKITSFPFSTAVSFFAIILFSFLPTSCSRGNVFKIGIVNTSKSLDALVSGFKQGLEKHFASDNISLEFHYSGAVPDSEIKTALKDLIDKRVNLIMAIPGGTAIPIKAATEGTDMPVVFAPCLKPLEMGLVDSMLRPGGNLTGVMTGGNSEKALEFHIMANPQTKRIFVPVWQNDAGAKQSLSDLRKAAAQFRISLVTAEITSAEQLKKVLETMPEGIDSLWLLNSVNLSSHIDLFVATAIKRKLLFSSGTSQYDRGALISYAQAPFATGEQAARLAYKILTGIPPGTLPVETAEFRLGLNLRSARAAGRTIPKKLIELADDIIR